MFQYILSDNESLQQYLAGEYVSFEDLKRRLFLEKRSYNREIPDHLYRLEQLKLFEGISSISELIVLALPKWISNYLDLNRNLIHVKLDQQNNWQEILTFLPPLFLQSLFLFKETVNRIKYDQQSIRYYFNEYILPNTLYTSIPSPRITQLDYFVEKNGGLYDLHMHLNGCLEMDHVWQDFLSNPINVYKSLKKGYSNSKVKEQLEQESSLLKPMVFYKILKIAQKLREIFYKVIFANSDEYDTYNLTIIVNNYNYVHGNYKHPFSDLIYNNSLEGKNLMSIEALMNILILNKIVYNKNEKLAGLYHFYLLILGLSNRLLVQQVHQNGFEQFQKNTLNELREYSERSYLRRFYQVSGNTLSNIKFLEGRFSPKKTQNDLIQLINKIYTGWDNFTKDFKLNHVEKKLPELKLIAHFIKRPEKKIHPLIRHKELRTDINARAQVLALLIKNYPNYRYKLCGIDAAASEFDASPEVFAPVFKKLRMAGIKHFTYHAGEDFFHIIDGLRAIYEAIVFCDLKSSDRIGHATASGLSVKAWANQIDNKLSIRKGDHLDNCIFCYHFITTNNIESLNKVLFILIKEINKLSFEIYGQYFPIEGLVQSWLLRQFCPIQLFKEIEDEKLGIFNSMKSYNEYKAAHCLLNIDIYNHLSDNIAFKIYSFYHDSNYRSNFDEIIQINAFSLLNDVQIEELQIHLLKFMSMKEIIIESLPTSNVRIGFHRDFSTYHLINWLKWKDEGKMIPSIVLGTDDSGIFSTNIYNEYANIYCALLHNHNISHSKIMGAIAVLNEDSKIYKFS